MSSAGTGWSGVLLEHHPAQPAPDFEHVTPHHAMCLQLTQGTVELDIQGCRNIGAARFAGETIVIPAGTAIRARGMMGELLALTLDPLWMRLQAEEFANPDRVELSPSTSVEDPVQASLLRALASDVRAGSPQGRLYGEALAATLAAHLIRHHSTAPALHAPRTAIAPAILRRVTEYVAAHLAESLRLAQLASLAGLSQFHFARAFKKSTGLAPHQYVVRRRVERARDLLLRGGGGVADVASQVGFADQSHLSAHFKRAFGTTPAAFARQARQK